MLRGPRRRFSGAAPVGPGCGGRPPHRNEPRPRPQGCRTPRTSRSPGRPSGKTGEAWVFGTQVSRNYSADTSPLGWPTMQGLPGILAQAGAMEQRSAGSPRRLSAPRPGAGDVVAARVALDTGRDAAMRMGPPADPDPGPVRGRGRGRGRQGSTPGGRSSSAVSPSSSLAASRKRCIGRLGSPAVSLSGPLRHPTVVSGRAAAARSVSIWTS
jgi:hypothetical protein